jgi:hypothetical protein
MVSPLALLYLSPFTSSIPCSPDALTTSLGIPAATLGSSPASPTVDAHTTSLMECQKGSFFPSHWLLASIQRIV